MRSIRWSPTALLAALTLVAVVPAAAYNPPGRTERVSTPSDAGLLGDSGASRLSADGQTVVFRSQVALVPEDTNGEWDTYVRDLRTGEFERISVSSSGAQILAEEPTSKAPPAISADGRVVAFESGAGNLVPGDTNGVDDVFVRFRDTGVTIRASVSAAGAEAAAHSSWPALSADGRYLFFLSEDDTLVPGDASPYEDIFRRDLQTGTLELVTVDSDGRQSVFDPTELAIDASGAVVAWAARSPSYDAPDANAIFSDVFVRTLPGGPTRRISNGHNGVQGTNHSYAPSLSADGRYVAFGSLADNIVPQDRNGAADIFVHDRQTGRTERVSLASTGAESGSGGGLPQISGDGRYVVFNGINADLDPDVAEGNTGTDTYVHDRLTGTTTAVSVTPDGGTGDAIAHSGHLSADGSRVVFQSGASDLTPGDTNEDADVFLRDLGPALGTGGAQATAAGAVSGWARFAGRAVSATDPANDATVQVRTGGGEIVAGRAAWRPERGDVRFVVDFDTLPGLPRANPGVAPLRYNIAFTLAKTAYQVRLDPTEGANPTAAPATGHLFRCAPTCTEIGTVPASLGGAGVSLIAVVPGALVGGFEGGRLSAISLSTSFSAPGVNTSGDSLALPDLALDAPRVEVGTAPAGSPVAQVVFMQPALLADGRFSADIGPAGGPRDVWTRACLGADCGAPVPATAG